LITCIVLELRSHQIEHSRDPRTPLDNHGDHKQVTEGLPTTPQPELRRTRLILVLNISLDVIWSALQCYSADESTNGTCTKMLCVAPSLEVLKLCIMPEYLVLDSHLKSLCRSPNFVCRGSLIRALNIITD
jgi:hypothetical protein